LSGAIHLEECFDTESMVRRLRRGGLSASSAKAKVPLFQNAARALQSGGIPGASEIRGYFVPGRIEVLGKHTDYAGGRTMVMAVEKGFCLLASPRGDSRVRIFAPAVCDQVEFPLESSLEPNLGHWSNYPMTVGRRLARNFGENLRGADIAFDSDLPAASGMSSSSALLTASYLILAAVNRLSERAEYRREIHSPEELAGYLGTIENGQSFGSLAGDKGVGTFGGSEDHTAILCSQPGVISQYSYCPVKFERLLPVPAGYVFAIGGSGVVAEKTGAVMEQYNRASRLATAVLRLWNHATSRSDGHLAAAVASMPRAAERMRDILQQSRDSEFCPDDLLARFGQFFEESEQIIPAAGNALMRGDIRAFGSQVARSQELTESLLRNQVPQTVYLSQLAVQLGASAASAFGAGFGGSVWALVKRPVSESFLGRWEAEYRQQFPATNESCNRAFSTAFFLTEAGPAAFELQQGLT